MSIMRRQVLSGTLIFLMAVAVTVIPAGAGGAGEDKGEGGGVRMPVDSIGYATLPIHVEAVVRASGKLIAAEGGPGDELPGSPMIGGICPHDDHIYAGPAYVKLLKNLDVPLVVLVGVSHRARRTGIQGGLVFGSFRAWKGPWGEIPVSGLREKLQARLPAESFMINDELQAGEHSIEGLIPFIQYYRSGKELEILPVLTTRMKGELFGDTAGSVAAALHELMEERGMRLGRDYAVIISADCVHYGDEGWGGRNYSPYGTSREGYDAAVAEEKEIASSTLTGAINEEKIKAFRDRIDSYEFEWPYKIPWCGVYSIPFGLTLLEKLCGLEGRDPPSGRLLDYSTSLDPGALELDTSGPGATNIATLRHWVGYTAVGYW